MKIDWFEWLTFGTAVTGVIRQVAKMASENKVDLVKIKQLILNAWYSVPAPIFDRIPEEVFVKCMDGCFDLVSGIISAIGQPAPEEIPPAQ